MQIHLVVKGGWEEKKKKRSIEYGYCHSCVSVTRWPRGQRTTPSVFLKSCRQVRGTTQRNLLIQRKSKAYNWDLCIELDSKWECRPINRLANLIGRYYHFENGEKLIPQIFFNHLIAISDKENDIKIKAE